MDTQQIWDLALLIVNTYFGAVLAVAVSLSLVLSLLSFFLKRFD